MIPMKTLIPHFLQQFKRNYYHTHPLLIPLTFFIILLSVSFTTAFPSLTTHTTMDSFMISLDGTQTNGVIKPYAEINCGPAPISYIENSVDLTNQYQDIGINFIRTHDFFGPTDVSTIFPDWDANPYEEESYNFTSSDEMITPIINTDCKVFYRLGESASDNNSLRIPPANMTKWAEVCKHIVMHYNDGWNNGYHYNITYWEIWNEPDLDGFWDGTADEYYTLYHTIVQTLKAYNPSLKIGGPCTSSIADTNFTHGFLTYLVNNEIPLDFYSWHHYADTPHDLYTSSRTVRNLLDSYGFADCESINTEWNINILTPQRDKDNAKNAAFTACSLTTFQDASIDHAFRYRGTQDNNWLMRLIGFDLALFTHDGIYKTPALSYNAMHYLIRDTPIRLTTPTMDASNGITYLAGISEDKTNISIIISNYEAPDTLYTLNLTNIPWNNTSYTAVFYLIDEDHHLEIVENVTSDKSVYSTMQTLEKSTIHFIRLTSSTVVPDEGPLVASIPPFLRLRIFDPIARIIGILIMILIFG